MRTEPASLLLSMPMRYFAAVANAGSVSRAAQQLHVAGSAVSRQVAALEDSLGVLLFDRAQRGMRLTAAGERLAAHLRVVADDARLAIARVQGLQHDAGRRVRIACTEGFAAGFLPAALQQFRSLQPQALLEITVTSPGQVAALLERKEADLGLLYAVSRVKGCSVHHDAAAPLVALMRADHPLARRRSLKVADIVRFPMLLAAPGTTARALFDAACAERGLQPRAAVTSNALAPMLPLLGAEEIALAGLAAAAHFVVQSGLVVVPFAPGELPSRRLQLLSWRGRELPGLAAECARSLASALRAAGERKPSGRGEA